MELVQQYVAVQHLICGYRHLAAVFMPVSTSAGTRGFAIQSDMAYSVPRATSSTFLVGSTSQSTHRLLT
jgi:hypothetical protein